MRVLLIGKSSGRLDCLADAIRRSKRIELFILTNLINEGLSQKGFVSIGPTDDPAFVVQFAEIYRGDTTTIAVISNEEPLAAGVTDALEANGIPVVGPTKALAQIETSKHFARTLLAKYNLAHMNPNWEVFGQNELKFGPSEISRIENHMHGFGKFVIKPDGLTGGKGVRVLGDHFNTIEEGLEYCREILDQGGSLLIEQKQEGQEFSLMSFSDGKTVIDMPLVQDHKRLIEFDIGPNTGGMGSYSDANHSLPICDKNTTNFASWINKKVIEILQKEIGVPYKGIIYGNYIITQAGLKVIEFNARFGDPEIMNVLSILETDFGDILFDITRGTLKPIQFAHKATVCKYLVPIGHPTYPKEGLIDLSQVVTSQHTRLYYGALDGDKLTGSRAAAVVGIADTIIEAERLAERAARQVSGPLYHRTDIGTREALQKRIDHTKMISK